MEGISPSSKLMLDGWVDWAPISPLGLPCQSGALLQYAPLGLKELGRSRSLLRQMGLGREIAMTKQMGEPSAEATGLEPGQAGAVNAQGKKTKQNLVTRVLAPALKLWLRSQVEAVERLEVALGSETGDGSGSLDGDRLSSRQMLAGRIPLVQVEADGVIYKGLYLGQLQLVGRDIRMNLGQAVRGQPLKLLAPIVVDLKLRMSEAQLNASLGSPLLAPHLGEWLSLLQELLVEDDRTAKDRAEGVPIGAEMLSQPRMALTGGELGADLGAERLGLRFSHGVQSVADQEGSVPSQVEPGARSEIAIETGLMVRNGNVLKLRQPRWSETPPAGFQTDLSGLAMMPLKLGRDVALEGIEIAAGQLQLTGQLTVQP